MTVEAASRMVMRFAYWPSRELSSGTLTVKRKLVAPAGTGSEAGDSRSRSMPNAVKRDKLSERPPDGVHVNVEPYVAAVDGDGGAGAEEHEGDVALLYCPRGVVELHGQRGVAVAVLA